jgi:ketosteroid isomerase-like protein
VGEENVEIVRQMYACFKARDNETPFDYFAEDVVWDARGPQIPGLDHVYRGHDGIRAFWRQWLEAWEEIEFETGEPVELDDGRVRVLVRQRNRGRGTGIWIEMDPYHHTWTVDGGKVTRVEFSWVGRS